MLFWLNLPSVNGCTDSLALVKRAMSFRGPPLERCCRWYFFSSDKGIKRFSILWYCTSTWERRKRRPSCFSASNCTCESLNWLTMLHLGLSGLLLGSKWTSFLSNWVWSTYASFTIWGKKRGELSWISVLSAALLKSLDKLSAGRECGAYFHDSCYTRFLAVAVVKESQLPFFHHSHEVARLEMIDNSEEHSHRERRICTRLLTQSLLRVLCWLSLF